MTSATARRPRVGDDSWMSRGACANRSDLPWIADPEHTAARDQVVMAAVCQGCPVLTHCEEYATCQKMTAGFWAGTNRDPDTDTRVCGPGWATEALPGLGRLGGAA